MGPWGEGSQDLHSLVKVIAETKVANKARALGRDMSDKELAGVNQRTKVHFYSCPTFIEIIFLPEQPYHIIDFSSNFKHEFSKLIHLFANNHKFVL